MTEQPTGHLTLARRKGECITLTHPDHGQIVVRVVNVRCNTVRLSFMAPMAWEIDRPDSPRANIPKPDPTATKTAPKPTRRVVVV
jgi:sRNA-binding carbon storage regulator CsrA